MTRSTGRSDSSRERNRMPSPEEALPGRLEPSFAVPERHLVLGTRLRPPYPEGLTIAVFGLGSFWSAERAFWQTTGVWSTRVGYAGGYTPNPTYEEVCTGRTGHAQIVQVVFSPPQVSYDELLQVFWEAHDPTQGMRQGHDVGTPYRSMVLFLNHDQRAIAEVSRAQYQRALSEAGHGQITTEIAPLRGLYSAEDYHQQYLHKVPTGYGGLGGTGIRFPRR